jgi:hypothetical protein
MVELTGPVLEPLIEHPLAAVEAERSSALSKRRTLQAASYRSRSFMTPSLPRKNCAVKSRGVTRRIPLSLLGLTGECRRVCSMQFVLINRSFGDEEGG